MRILIVEDDELTAEALKTLLDEQNYAVELATNGKAAAELVDAFEYDLILSDVMLPELDGVSLCRQLRSKGYQIPILLLTGKDSNHNKAIGLDAGADDYVVKPFDPEELAARIRALLRRGNTTNLPILEWENLQLDPKACQTKYKGASLQLTPKEYALLELLMRNSRRVFSCGMILEHLWTYDDTPGEDAVRTHIKGLRQKLKAAGTPPDLIETVYGIGYRLKPLSELGKSHVVPPTEETRIRQHTMSAIADIWVKFQPRISEQMDLLEQAAAAFDYGSLEVELKKQAQQEAHTLIGRLGTFGLTKGSQLARGIEHLLKSDTSLSNSNILQIQQDVALLRQEFNQASHPATQLTSESRDQMRYPIVLIVGGAGSHRTWLDDIESEAQQREIHYQTVTSIVLAEDSIQKQSPHLVLFEPAVESVEQSLAFLQTLNQHSPPIPVLIVTDDNHLSQKIAVAYSDEKAFVSTTLSTQQIWDRVEQALQLKGLVEAKVMIVDDDPQTLETVMALFRPWGVEVTALADPTQFWQTLTNNPPDLLVLDVEMPEISGIDLCKVVRKDAQWEQLPIIFLTAHTEPDIVNRVYAVGADDFVSKPIVGPELVVRILNRLDRTRLQQRLSAIDPLTRVLTRYEPVHYLESLLDDAQHHPKYMCLVILEIERLQQINDCFGYAMGDSILREFAQTLLQSTSQNDVVARRSGEQFLVGLIGSTKTEGIQKLKGLLTAVHRAPFIMPDGTPIQIICSAGVAHCPDDSNDFQELSILAEAALTEARAMGWGQMRIANSPVERSQ